MRNATIEGVKTMSYHKNKQEAYQAAEQSVHEVKEQYDRLTPDSTDYGSQLKHLQHEVNEARQQILNALEVASETQRKQLQQYRNELETIAKEINE